MDKRLLFFRIFKTDSDSPKVIQVTPEGSRIVDAMSILDSPNARRHLDELSGLSGGTDQTEAAPSK